MAKRPQEDAVERLFDETRNREHLRIELMSLVCSLFLEGKNAHEIQTALQQSKYARYTRHFKREDSWRLVRKAAREGFLSFKPPLEFKLANGLVQRYRWPEERVTVVASPVPRDLASRAAAKLLDLIRTYKSFACDPVHIGFAGGRMLRRVAEELAMLLCEPSSENPQKIVFHGMVAALDEEHYESDPNNFITYFIQQPVSVEIAFVSMPAPGFVETGLRAELHKLEMIRQVYERGKEIHIIVTSGGSWRDEHSALRNYMSKTRQSDVDKLQKLDTIGDILWQPISLQGPIDMERADLEFRANTLVDLADLPARIGRGPTQVRVMPVLGACGECLEPHGEVLHAILNSTPRLVTDVITALSNVHDLFREQVGANG
jgi:DNA-binding transcriptional regulator LsrR (DeoR family)